MSATRRGFLGLAALGSVSLMPSGASAADAGPTRLVVLYNMPKDTAAFDKYYMETHVPKVVKLPGLISYTVNDGPVLNAATGPAATQYYFFAELGFETLPSMNAALSSPAGTAVTDDLPNFASAGTTILFMNTKALFPAKS